MQRISKTAERSGMHFVFHIRRHAFETTMLKNGVSIYSLQRLLGHSDFETT